MRAKNIMKNSFFSIFSQLMIVFAGFFCRRVMSLQLGEEMVGLNNTISNIIANISVTELGLSTAVVFHLYRAVAEGNEKKIAALMNLYRKAYFIVAAVITVIGMALLPFVHVFMKDNHYTIPFIRLIFILWLVKTVFSYLLSYKRSIVVADQKDYISSLAVMAASILNYLSVIVIVSWNRDYVLAFEISIVFEVLTNMVVNAYVDKTYPFLKKYRKDPVERGLIRSVFADIKNILVTRVSNKLLGSTDNLIISGIIALGISGIYSNYCLIAQSIINLIQSFSNALQPTVGNVIVDKNEGRDYNVLQILTYLFFMIGSVAMAGVAAVSTPFVTDIWLGEGWELSVTVVSLCAANVLLTILVMPLGMFLNVSGLFKQEKWVTLVSALVNLAISIVGVFLTGLIGVLLGTMAAYLIQLAGKAFYFFREHLHRPLRRYLISLAGYLLAATCETALCMVLANALYSKMSASRWLGFLSAGALCVILPTVINLALYCRTERFRGMLDFLNRYARRGGKG